MDSFLATETLIVILLLVMSLVAIVVRRVRLTYTVALVLVGLLISFLQPFDIQVTPDLILALLIPPLVFEAAFQLDLAMLRENLVGILVMAVPGVLLTAFIVGGVVTLTVGIPLAVSVVFGALIAATDPVAVIAVFRRMGAPRSLAVAVEGESLLNDGTAIVVYKIAMAAALTHVFSPASGVLSFLVGSLGGLAVGFVMGWLVAQLIAHVDDALIEVTLTTVLAYGSYLVAERLQVSGVLAAVAAGIVGGSVGLRGMSPSTRLMLYSFWEYAAFLANSFVFLLIGAQVHIPLLAENWRPILFAVLAVLAGRALAVYGLSWLSRWLSKGVPHRWPTVFFWGGLRGAIALALALGLPKTLPHREMLQAMTFGVVLFTLLVQGTTIQPLLRRLGLTELSEAVLERETRWGRLYSAQAAQRRLLQLHSEGMVAGDIWAGVSEEYRLTSKQLTAEVDQLYTEYPELERGVVMQARREALKAERTALRDALVRGWLSNQSYEVLAEEVDRRLEALRLIGAQALGPPVTSSEGDD